MSATLVNRGMVGTVRFARTHGETILLTAEELEAAEILKVKAYPTVHGTDEIEIECPTPEICGYFVGGDDRDRIIELLSWRKRREEA